MCQLKLKIISLLLNLTFIGIIFSGSLLFIKNDLVLAGEPETENTHTSNLSQSKFGRLPVSTKEPTEIEFMWDKRVWINNVEVEGVSFNALQISDTVTIADYLWFTHTTEVTFTLNDSWNNALYLTDYALQLSDTLILPPAESGNLELTGTYQLLSDTHIFTAMVQNGPTGQYIISKTFGVSNGTPQIPAYITETLWLDQVTTQPDPIKLSFEQINTQTFIYLPVVLKNFTPATPPTISDLQIEIIPNDPNCIFADYRHALLVEFNFTDPNGNVGGFAQSKAVFQPSGDTLEADNIGADLIQGDGYAGRISLEKLCIIFTPPDTNVTLYYWLFDLNLLQSNPLSKELTINDF